MDRQITLSPSAYPAILPEAVQEFFGAYDNGETDEESVRYLTQVLAMDLAYLQDHPVQDDLQLRAIRTQQAECVQFHIGRIGSVLRTNMLFLGQVLIEAQERYLYTYLGFRSMEAWCETLNVEATTLKKAKQLASLWPWLRQFGYTMLDVVDGTITEEKIRFLQQLHTTKKYERGHQAVEVYTEHYGELPQAEETKNPKVLAREVQRKIDLLPEDAQEAIQEEIQKRYVAQMRKEIDHIRTNPLDALIAGQNELRNLVSKPHILLKGKRRGKKIEGTFSFECTEAEALALIAGQYWLEFQLPGHDPMSPSRFGEFLNEEGWPDED